MGVKRLIIAGALLSLLGFLAQRIILSESLALASLGLSGLRFVQNLGLGLALAGLSLFLRPRLKPLAFRSGLLAGLGYALIGLEPLVLGALGVDQGTIILVQAFIVLPSAVLLGIFGLGFLKLGEHEGRSAKTYATFLLVLAFSHVAVFLFPSTTSAYSVFLLLVYFLMVAIPIALLVFLGLFRKAQ